MTLAETKQWLLDQCEENPISPYKNGGLKIPADLKHDPTAPVGKMYGVAGGLRLIFLTKDWRFVYWLWDTEPRQISEEELPHPSRRGTEFVWSREHWYLDQGPRVISDWYLEEGML